MVFVANTAYSSLFPAAWRKVKKKNPLCLHFPLFKKFWKRGGVLLLKKKIISVSWDVLRGGVSTPKITCAACEKNRRFYRTSENPQVNFFFLNYKIVILAYQQKCLFLALIQRKLACVFSPVKWELKQGENKRRWHGSHFLIFTFGEFV